MLDRFLHSKWLYLAISFISFLLLWIIILNSFLPEIVHFEKKYLYFVHSLSIILIINIINLIFKEKTNNLWNIFTNNIFIKIFILFLVWFSLYNFTNFSNISLSIILFIIYSIIFFLDSRYSFLIALVLLIYTPFYLIIGNEAIAEQLSIYAYYFLVIWVWLEIFHNSFKKNIHIKN